MTGLRCIDAPATEGPGENANREQSQLSWRAEASSYPVTAA